MTAWRRPLMLFGLLLAAIGCAGSPDAGPGEPPPDLDTRQFHPHLAAALDRARAAVLEQMESAAHWGELGMLLHAHELMAPARRCYERAMRLDPGDYRWPYLIAVRHDFGELDAERKLDLLLRARELNPRYAPVDVRIGDLLMELGRTDEAGLHYEAALAANPESSHALLGLGRIALAAGDAQRSRSLLEEARWHDRQHLEVYATLVRVYTALGLPALAQRAEALMQRAEGAALHDPLLLEVRRRSLRPDQMRRRAGRSIRRGDYEQALALLDTVVELAPHDAEARVLRGRALILTWRDEEGLAELEAANAIDPGSVDIPRRIERWRVERVDADRPSTVSP